MHKVHKVHKEGPQSAGMKFCIVEFYYIAMVWFNYIAKFYHVVEIYCIDVLEFYDVL